MKTLLVIAALALSTSGFAMAKQHDCTRYVTNYNANLTTHCDFIVASGGGGGAGPAPEKPHKNY